MALNDSWKQIFFSAITSVTSALEVFQRDALYKSTFYSLAYFTRHEIIADSDSVRGADVDDW